MPIGVQVQKSFQLFKLTDQVRCRHFYAMGVMHRDLEDHSIINYSQTQSDTGIVHNLVLLFDIFGNTEVLRSFSGCYMTLLLNYCSIFILVTHPEPCCAGKKRLKSNK